jgi:hypothetical protein
LPSTISSKSTKSTCLIHSAMCTFAAAQSISAREQTNQITGRFPTRDRRGRFCLLHR